MKIFQKFVVKKKNENLAIFHNRVNDIVANEVNDVICKTFGIASTIRHVDCEFIVAGQKRCDKCKNYRSSLRAFRSKLTSHIKKDTSMSQSFSHSFTNNRYLSQNQLISKLDERKKEIKSLSSENVYLRIQIESLIEVNGVTTSEDLNTALKGSLEELKIKASEDFPEGSSLNLLFNEELKQTNCKSASQMRRHPLMIRWCLGLYHTSPCAYEFIKKSCFFKLPHKSTLLDYSIYATPQTGFNPETIQKLYEEADLDNIREHERNVSLLFDEMKIHTELIYSKSTGKLIAFVEMGNINTEMELLERKCLAEKEDKSKEKELATHSLAFMVRGIYTKLQFCIGFFATKDIKAENIFPMAWEAVSVLESIGFMVRCFVSDGASPNRTFYKMHNNSSSLVSYFTNNLCCTTRKIYFICDVPHLVKTVRNNWEISHGNRNTRNLLVNKFN